ncbi:cytochrome c biogenesis protein CcdA [uncultured Gulosibacter sp.]|uniref:cytochrome c biogenesis CcdA family protein n=1 Tax=uncultured Gulosibacter sp. TaxID=1339167 RepID=UPI00288A386C|nr:cytochrome c biogenesis protein CcdA [uncultured Gulosibacter sp.]
MIEVLAASPGEIIVSGQLVVALPLALLAGLVSFASPCVLPVVPAYLGLIGATTEGAAAEGAVARAASDADNTGAKRSATSAVTQQRAETPQRRDGGRVVLGSLLFVLGFSVIYVITGAAFGQLGVLFLRWQDPITRVLGVLVILMGIVFLGLVTPLQRTLRLRATPAGLMGAPLLGMVFGLGWAPCLGPTLVAIQSLSFQEASAWRGALLAFAYCLGLGAPFVLAAFGWQAATRWLGWLKRHVRIINIIGGSILVLIGLLMVTGAWSALISQLGAVLPGYVTPI